MENKNISPGTKNGQPYIGLDNGQFTNPKP